MLSLAVRNGLIVDGTGRPPYPGDVGLRGRRIVEVGEVSSRAVRTIDADGAIVTPGFVDIHTHYDGQVSWDTQMDPSARNGVTSIVMGNCGVGFAPARPDRHDWLIQLLEGVEDIPGSVLSEGLQWDWETFPEYMDAIERRNYTIDIGVQVPHSALRAYVMGDRGGSPEAVPTELELAEMEQHLYESLERGALGFTTSRSMAHRSKSGAEIGTLKAGQLELLGIAHALRRSGKGVIQLISDVYMTTDDDFADAELRLIKRLMESTGRSVSFTVQQTIDAPDRWRHLYAEVARMAGEGLPVKTQVASRPLGFMLSFCSTMNPFMGTPTYCRISDGATVDQRLRALADPGIRAAILEEHSQKVITGPAAVKYRGVDGKVDMAGFGRTLLYGFDRMYPMDDPVDYEPGADQSLAARALRAGIDPVRYAYDALLEQGGRRFLHLPLLNYAHGTLDDLHAQMMSPHALWGLSDGGAHCSTICDASFPTSTVGMWTRGIKSGRSIPLEHAVHGYTQRNARHVGWTDRGVIAPGFLADLNVIDHDNLTLGPPAMVQDLPAGGTRLIQEPRGYLNTIKSGVVTFERGRWTGATPGTLVRGAQRSRKPSS